MEIAQGEAWYEFAEALLRVVIVCCAPHPSRLRRATFPRGGRLGCSVILERFCVIESMPTKSRQVFGWMTESYRSR